MLIEVVEDHFGPVGITFGSFSRVLYGGALFAHVRDLSVRLYRPLSSKYMQLM